MCLVWEIHNTVQSQPESEPRRERHDPVVVDVQKCHLAELLASDEAKLKQDVFISKILFK